MIKPLPPRTISALAPPNTNYSYFENFQQNAFKPNADSFDLGNAWWLAELSLLAYAHEPFINDTFSSSGLTAAGFGVEVIPKDDIQCCVISNDKSTIVAFRGTQIDNFWGSLANWLTDVRFAPFPDGFGGHVHKGFWDALSGVWSDLANRLGQLQNQAGAARTLWFTGHSLGAAMATLAADRTINELHLQVAGLYTFGSPHVGDDSFRSRFYSEGLGDKTFRFRNNRDIVTTVPPKFLYPHVGTLKYLDGSGQLQDIDDAQLPGPPNVLRVAEQLLAGAVPGVLGGHLSLPIPDPIADHAPIYYAIHVWNNYAGTE